MPNVITADMLNRMGIPTEKFNAKFDDMMRVGQERILKLQQSTGGWSWFDRGAEDPFMTALAVHGLSECDRLGTKVDAVALKRGRARLLELAKRETDLNQLAFAAYVLGEEYDRLLKGPEKLSSYAQALLVLTLHKADHPRTEEICKLLADRVVKDHWETPMWHHRWENVRIETTAYAIQALAAVDPKHPLIQPAVRWLLEQRSGNRWRSTKDTAVAIVTLLKVADLSRIAEAVEVKGREKKKPRIMKRIGIGLNGGELREVLIDVNNPTASDFESHFDRIMPGPQEIRFEPLDDVSDFEFDFDLSQRILDGTPGDAARGVFVSVEYDTPLDSLRRGDEVTATVSVNASETVDYLMVLSPIPAGCEVIRGSGTGTFARFEDRYEKAIFFLEKLGPKTMRYTYRMRANFAGEYTVLPAWAGLMYNEDIYGTAAARRASIAP